MTNKYDDMVAFAESINKPVTNVNLCKAMADLARIFNPTSILDPNAGMGEILYYCDYGQVIDGYSTDTDNIAIGRDVNNKINFMEKSFLSENMSQSYDLIISQIPFSYGLNQTGSGESFLDLAYIGKILKSLNKDGVFVGLMPGRFAFEDYSLEMRNFIMENYSLEILVELPYDKYKIKNHNLNIIVIKNKGQSENVLIVDYNENINQIIHKYLGGEGDGFINKALLKDKWNKYYHSNKFNLLNLYKPSNFILLGEVGKFIQGSLFGKASIRESGDLIIINKSNLVNGRILPTSHDKYSSHDLKSQVNHILKDGDILVNLTMDGHCNVARYTNEDPPGIIQHFQVIIRSDDQYFKEFMATVSGLSFFEDYLNRHLIPTNNRVNISDIKKFKIPLFHTEDLSLIEKKYNNSLKEEDILSRLNNIKREIQACKNKKEQSQKIIDELKDKIKISDGENEKLRDKLIEEEENNKRQDLYKIEVENNKALFLKMFKDDIEKLHKRFDNLENNIEKSNEGIHRVEETVVRVEESVNKYGRLIEDIHTMVTDLYKIQESILEKLNKADNEDEKEDIYVELTDKILKLIDENYEITRSQNIDKVEKEYKDKFTEAGWNKLNKDTRKHLITAQVIYNDLKSSEQLDFSPVCIALTKALEIELFIHLFNKMQSYFKKNKNTVIRHLPDGILFKSSYQRSQFFSLGKVPYVLCLDFEESYHRPMKDELKEEKIKSLNEFLDSGLFKDEAFENNIERDKYIKELGKSVEDITKEYRNPAAHRDSLTMVDAGNCHNLIINIDKILINFINKLA